MTSASPRVYTTYFDNVAISAAQDFFSLKAGSAIGVEIHQFQFTSSLTSDTPLRLVLKRFTSPTQGSGGSNPTATAADGAVAGNIASATTVHLNDTSAGSGTQNFGLGFLWNSVLPLDYLPAPEDRPTCQPGSMFVLNCPSSPTSQNISGYIKWAEVP